MASGSLRNPTSNYTPIVVATEENISQSSELKRFIEGKSGYTLLLRDSC